MSYGSALKNHFKVQTKRGNNAEENRNNQRKKTVGKRKAVKAL